MVKGSGQSAKEVERIVGDFERSGLSRRAYSERSGIAIRRLDWYRRRTRASRSAANLVPVRVKKAIDGSVGDVRRDTERGFTLVLENGLRIETGWSFDEGDLTRLIRTAGAA
jgi:hypothetical protein